MPSGSRVLAYTRRGAVIKVAQLAAPLLQLAYFALRGEAEWSESTLVPALVAGAGTL